MAKIEQLEKENAELRSAHGMSHDHHEADGGLQEVGLGEEPSAAAVAVLQEVVAPPSPQLPYELAGGGRAEAKPPAAPPETPPPPMAPLAVEAMSPVVHVRASAIDVSEGGADTPA